VSRSARTLGPYVGQRGHGRVARASARLVVSLVLLTCVCAYTCALIGTRSLDTGTDTRVYAGFFLSMGEGPVETRLEPGFVLFTQLLRWSGASLQVYFGSLFALLLLTAVLATKELHAYLGEARDYLTLLTASLLLLLLSPMFVNASINTLRQGLASLLVFAALLCFHRRRWVRFALYGALASSLHYSSLLFLAFAPVLLASTRTIRVVGAAAFVVYCSGLSDTLVLAAAPGVHAAVMDYVANATFRAGTRVDFALFSVAWYLVPTLGLRLVRAPLRERLRESTSVYLVLLLPFFAVGFGNFSNRYLLPAWLTASLLLAAMLCHSRLAPLRSRLVLQFGLLASCPVFAYFVDNGIII
jgi:hypothetical protein